MADGDCPDEEMDCRCAKMPDASDSLVAERTRSSNCAIDGSCWLGEAADSGDVDDGGGWRVWIDGNFSPGKLLDGESLRPRRCGDMADVSGT